jgi:hypothetical protein
MTCHSQIWTGAEVLAPVRQSLVDNVPLHWNRVHSLPDYVFFNHSIHVAKGIGCATCHGQVDRMERVYQAASLQMSWCLECHRHPERYIRPPGEVFNMNWQPSEPREAWAPALVEQLGIDRRRLDHCYICHR